MKFSAARSVQFSPYTPGEQNNGKAYVRLNTNESPYPPPQSVLDAAARAAAHLNFYSDPALREIKSAIADSFDVAPDMVSVSNGSDEALGFIFAAFAESIVSPDVTYGFYSNLATFFGIPYEEIPLNDDFTLNPEDYCGRDKTIVISNPAAHTGLTMNNTAISIICEGNPDNLVIIDEAYAEFSNESAVPLLDRFENLVIVRTLSKSRFLAGLRVGFVIASAEIIHEIERVRSVWSPYNVGSVGIAAGSAAMKASGYYNERIRELIDTREYFKRELREIDFFVTDSKANFVLCETNAIPGKKLYEALKERGYLTRNLSNPRISNMLRISIGARHDMENLVSILKSIAGGKY